MKEDTLFLETVKLTLFPFINFLLEMLSIPMDKDSFFSGLVPFLLEISNLSSGHSKDK